MSTTTNHKRTRIIALVTALLVVAGILGIAPRVSNAIDNTGTLEVTKTFVNGAETDEATFIVSLPEGSQVTLPESYTISSSQEPVTIEPGSKNVTFKLKNNEKATFQKMSPGTFTVKEDPVPTDFSASISVKEGESEPKEVKEASADVNIVAEKTTTVAVTNTKNTPTPTPTPTTETGNLVITKKIDPETEELKKKEFTFRVTLTKDEQPDTNQYACEGTDRTSVGSGEAFQLKGGQTITIKGIPVDTEYTVTEDPNLPAGWTLSKKENDTGKITKDGSTASFTNTYKEPGTGDLKITKTVVTDYLDKLVDAYTKEGKHESTIKSLQETKSEALAKKFTFTVKLTDKDGKELADDEYKYTGKVGGEDVTDKKIKSGETVELAHEDTITITGLPVDTKYSVTETEESGYQVDKATQDGTIASNDTADATFKNTPTGGLLIKKNIQSKSGKDLSDVLKAQEFTFTVNFRLPEYDSETQSIVYKDIEGEEFAYTGDRSGTVKSGDTITLKGGESVTFTNLQVGMNARVEETPADNWQASAKALTGDIRLNMNRTATITNTYQDADSSGTTTPKASSSTTASRTTTPATADGTNVAVPVVLGVLAAGMVVAGRMTRSKE